MPTRKSYAVWEGALKDGKGYVTLGSGAFEGPYTFASRFESGAGTNPEELLGAAHAGCFSMAFAHGLSQEGFPPKQVATVAHVTVDNTPSGLKITRIDLLSEASVPGIGEAAFLEIAERAKKNCPVSRALAGTEITLKAKLEA